MDLTRRGGELGPTVVAVAAALTAIAVLVPSPWYITERDIFQRIGREFFIPDCSSLHCTRVLMSWILEQLPGPSLFKWKVYAIVGGTIAAAGTARFAQQVGLSDRVARWSAWLVAFGSGVQITLFDPYGPDPFIYAVTPWMLLWIVQGRVWLAGSIGVVGVLAKEFAAAPLWIGMAYALQARRRDLFWRCSAAAMSATFVWVMLQIALILGFNYSYGGSPSALVFQGGNFTRWFRLLGPTQSLGALVVHVAPLVMLAWAAWRAAPSSLRQLIIASIPPLLALIYVQQPDRAIWNFQAVLAPLGALQLATAAPGAAWLFVGGYAASNLRVVPQVARFLTPAAFALCAIGVIRVVLTSRARSLAITPAASVAESGHAPIGGSRWPGKVSAAVAGAALVFSLVWAADIFMHRRGEDGAEVNIWGYRGPVVRQKVQDEIRIVVLGGSVAFGREVRGSVPSFLQDYLNNVRLRGDASYQSSNLITVINLGTPYDHVAAFQGTLDDYAWLRDDVVCLYLGHDDPAPSVEAATVGWRRQSAVFRASGYMPILPALVMPRGQPTMPVRESDAEYLSALEQTINRVLTSGRRVIVATHPFITEADGRRQDVVAARLRERFTGDKRGSYVDLRRSVSLDDPKLVEDGIHQTVLGGSVIAESLSQSVFRLLEAGG